MQPRAGVVVVVEGQRSVDLVVVVEACVRPEGPFASGNGIPQIDHSLWKDESILSAKNRKRKKSRQQLTFKFSRSL